MHADIVASTARACTCDATLLQCQTVQSCMNSLLVHPLRQSLHHIHVVHWIFSLIERGLIAFWWRFLSRPAEKLVKYLLNSFWTPVTGILRVLFRNQRRSYGFGREQGLSLPVPVRLTQSSDLNQLLKCMRWNESIGRRDRCIKGKPQFLARTRSRVQNWQRSCSLSFQFDVAGQ